MHRDILLAVYPRYRLLGALPQTPEQIHFILCRTHLYV